MSRPYNTKDISTLFLDIGGVLLTNGWDGDMRRKAAEKFGLDYDEMNERHNLIYDAYERGLISLDEYIGKVVFHRNRPFTTAQFKKYMFSMSRPFNDTIELFKKTAHKHRLKVAAVNNEGRELNDYRIRKFHLAELIEFFISSCFVHFRKPDEAIFKLALDIAQVPARQVLYIDDREFFVEVAAGLGINAIYHQDIEKTKKAIARFGLATD
jgi:putative hydrolase of the HAD superfamily